MQATPLAFFGFDRSQIGADYVSGTVTLSQSSTVSYTASGVNGGAAVFDGTSYLYGALASLPVGSSAFSIVVSFKPADVIDANGGLVAWVRLG